MTTTTHFKNPRSGKALCAGFRQRFTYYATTENRAEVNCTRCAKKLGIAPAAKPASKNRTGTCQCCFGSQKVNQAHGKNISLHGYKRPGVGYITGRCRGENEVPFEVSCEKTKVFREELVNFKGHVIAQIAKLNNNEVESLAARIETNEREPNAYHNKEVFVTVLRGAAETQNPYFPNSPWIKVPGFAKLVKAELAKQESILRHVSSDIAELTTRIDAWVKVWES